ncbi:hypothetical protein GCM10011325_06120 [Dyadobacter sediminis]|nr:hypothetical protein GCM10011325_06120 [Dyadobacter sediminis]
MELLLGLNPSSMEIDPLYATELEDALLHFWIPKTQEFPMLYYWYTNWEIVLKSTNTSIGGIGFVGYPNEKKEAEIGYMIDANEQGKGYATEALKTLSAWAFQQKDVDSVIVRTAHDNIASIKILDKNGFRLVSKVDDLLTYYLPKQ